MRDKLYDVRKIQQNCLCYWCGKKSLSEQFVCIECRSWTPPDKRKAIPLGGVMVIGETD